MTACENRTILIPKLWTALLLNSTRHPTDPTNVEVNRGSPHGCIHSSLSLDPTDPNPNVTLWPSLYMVLDC